jgi:drug/metabolite transporter (DMT)-like permease
VPSVWLWVTPTWPEFAALIMVGFLGIFGQWMITHAWTLGDTTALAPLDYLRIVYSALLGYLVFSELPGLWSFAGMALIVASSLYLMLSESKRVRGMS